MSRSFPLLRKGALGRKGEGGKGLWTGRRGPNSAEAGGALLIALGIAERRMEASRDVDPLLPVTPSIRFRHGIDRRMRWNGEARWISIVQEGHPWIGKDTDSCRPSISEARRMRSVRRIHPREIGFQRLVKRWSDASRRRIFMQSPALRTRFRKGAADG